MDMKAELAFLHTVFLDPKKGYKLWYRQRDGQAAKKNLCEDRIRDNDFKLKEGKFTSYIPVIFLFFFCEGS